jgi:hypothetical protein
MTKVLFWNLAQFGINKINSASLAKGENQGGLTNQAAATWRRRVIYRTLQYTQPDIIVVIEVGSGDSWPNDLATFTGGMTGASFLLNFLRTSMVYNAGNWRMVPPLRIGRKPGSRPETVAILYRGNSVDNGVNVTRYFTGPNVWIGGHTGHSVDPADGYIPNAYPTAAGGSPDIRVMLVPGGGIARTIPPTALHNPNRQEDRVAARTEFRINDNGAPGELLDFDVFRPPFMATFYETSTAGVRNVTLFSIHSPAVAGDSEVFMSYLASAFDISSPLGLQELRVIGGDFNVNLFDGAGAYSHAYDALTNVNYQYLLAPSPTGPGPNLSAYQGYYATHIKPVNKNNRKQASKFLWSDAATPSLSYYPGYNYIGSDQLPDFYSIDNILVNPFNGAANYQTTVMNHVVGTPMNRVMPIPGGAPPGTLALVEGFTNPAVNPWPGNAVPTAPNWTLGNRASLTSWFNYGYLYRTSDHFAVYAAL